MNRTAVLTTLIAIASTACGPVSSEVLPTEGDPSQDFVLPVVPIRTLSTSTYYDAEPGRTVYGEYELSVGFGPDYAPDLSLLLGLSRGRCQFEGQLTATSATSADEGIVQVRIEAGQPKLQVLAPGEVELQIAGSYTGACPWGGDDNSYNGPVAHTVILHVIEPGEAMMQRGYHCSAVTPQGEEPVYISGSTLDLGTAVVPLGPDGGTVYLSNAEAGRQLPITLRPLGTVELAWGNEDPQEGVPGLPQVQVEGEGRVEVIHDGAVVDAFDVASPGSITDIELGFVVPYGNGREDIVLTDGDTVDWDRAANFAGRLIVPMAGLPYVGDTASCSTPNPQWFTVGASPEQDEPNTPFEWRTYDLRSVGQPVEIVQNETTTLTLRAPAIDGGQGASHEITVDFTGRL